MPSPTTAALPSSKKPATFGMDKIRRSSVADILSRDQRDALAAWIALYYQVHVQGSPQKTETAKQQDLTKFLTFFKTEVGHDQIDNWTPAITKHFQQALKKTLNAKTGKLYKATTINRVMATVRHFAGWLYKQRPLLAGHPLAGVKDLQPDDPDWNGLTPRQLMRLKAACEQRIKACQRNNQDPLKEAGIFYTLYGSGLRRSELVALDVHQYHHKGLHEVVRSKNKRISKKIPLPQEARDFLDRYLTARNAQPDEPLFVSSYGNRLAAEDVRRIGLRILKQASAYLEPSEQFHFTPHKLRHTFLKRVTDKHGVHFAQQVSGNVSIKEIFRYAKPSQAEIDETVEQLFE